MLRPAGDPAPRLIPNSMPRPTDFFLSVVVPCFNEQEVILATHDRLSRALTDIGHRFEIIYVDDGSQDSTPKLLDSLAAVDSTVRILRFSRNFGHQIAVTAGMDHATGDAVILIDADLQDPPELISQFVERWRAGADVVYGQRTERDGETLFKRLTASLFYRGLRLLTPIDIPRDTGDFRLMDRLVVDALQRMPEHDRFIRGMVSWVGFRQEAIPYRREARFAGSSKYPFRKMLRLASDAVIAFSPVPLRIASVVGMMGFGTASLGLLGMFLYASGPAPLAINVCLMLTILIVASAQLMAIGLVGEYIGRIYRQVQNRPLYLLAAAKGFPAIHPLIHRNLANRDDIIPQPLAKVG